MSETKARRISGKAYHKLKQLRSELQDMEEKQQKWYESKLVNEKKEMYLYPDQVNFLTGRIVDAMDAKKTIDRLPFADVEKARKDEEAIQKKRREITKLVERIAEVANTLPRLIDQTTGEIVKALRTPTGMVAETITEVEVLDIGLDDDDTPVEVRPTVSTDE